MNPISVRYDVICRVSRECTSISTPLHSDETLSGWMHPERQGQGIEYRAYTSGFTDFDRYHGVPLSVLCKYLTTFDVYPWAL